MVIHFFWARTNRIQIFLFPWLHHGESISNFEKYTLFHGDAIFRPLGSVNKAKNLRQQSLQ